jgi:hypothetical protein
MQSSEASSLYISMVLENDALIYLEYWWCEILPYRLASRLLSALYCSFVCEVWSKLIQQRIARVMMRQVMICLHHSHLFSSKPLIKFTSTFCFGHLNIWPGMIALLNYVIWATAGKSTCCFHIQQWTDGRSSGSVAHRGHIGWDINQISWRFYIPAVSLRCQCTINSSTVPQQLLLSVLLCLYSFGNSRHNCVSNSIGSCKTIWFQ